MPTVPPGMRWAWRGGAAPSGVLQPLGGLFQTWLYDPAKPSAPAARDAGVVRVSGTPAQPRAWKAISATNGVHGHG
ncbi:hypothetical protein [Streptomyces himalayensis]|uniref:Uncharacterized protein n=1 Tax=Streptomyces himalayensis subsp. himalayensis TaxID=2756131 RepID=A0A7W0DQC6_9ACTN|nr:hypothetical protein [Streptomyces himalayensis]MBA2949327.1 hypothetical protein [Streptomyces himalayensis subsp. himalayensis]